MRFRKGNSAHSRVFKCVPNVFLENKNPNNGTITFIYTQSLEARKRDTNVKLKDTNCSINVYKYHAIKQSAVVQVECLACLPFLRDKR